MNGSWQDQAPVSHKRRKRLALAKKFPATLEDLVALAAASTKVATKLPPGVALNWRPSWMKQTDQIAFEHPAEEVQVPEPHIAAVTDI